VGFPLVDHLDRLEVDDHDVLVPGAGVEIPVIRGDLEGTHEIGVSIDREDLLTGLQVPASDSLVIGSGVKVSSIGRVLDGINSC
jgi:hypothetical protein